MDSDSQVHCSNCILIKIWTLNNSVEWHHQFPNRSKDNWANCKQDFKGHIATDASCFSETTWLALVFIKRFRSLNALEKNQFKIPYSLRNRIKKLVIELNKTVPFIIKALTLNIFAHKALRPLFNTCFSRPNALYVALYFWSSLQSQCLLTSS